MMKIMRIMQSLHTSKRMHFIEDNWFDDGVLDDDRLHTSKRMHFIEEVKYSKNEYSEVQLAYVKTYALH